jgi:hypothetical protein
VFYYMKLLKSLKINESLRNKEISMITFCLKFVDAISKQHNFKTHVLSTQFVKIKTFQDL